MLKITTKERPHSVSLVLEGRLCHPWTEEVEHNWSKLTSTAGDKELLLDLAGVTFVDRDGEDLLASMIAGGTKVLSSGVLISHMVEQAQKRCLHKPAKSSRGTPNPQRERGVP